mmetsp:Transcript_32883/g.76807  ORF Transcript_32883/g.76807 Transcript_32883/m.76807 type:complete len:240 (-) Transcript_32883:3651-4370(-)
MRRGASTKRGAAEPATPATAVLVSSVVARAVTAGSMALGCTTIPLDSIRISGLCCPASGLVTTNVTLYDLLASVSEVWGVSRTLFLVLSHWKINLDLTSTSKVPGVEPSAWAVKSLPLRVALAPMKPEMVMIVVGLALVRGTVEAKVTVMVLAVSPGLDEDWPTFLTRNSFCSSCPRISRGSDSRAVALKMLAGGAPVPFVMAVLAIVMPDISIDTLGDDWPFAGLLTVKVNEYSLFWP